MKIVFLKPRSAFRNRLRSDSLFGLIIWGIEKIHGKDKVASLIEEFKDSKPPFLVSSAFPFKNSNGNRELYFPKPINRPPRKDVTLDTMASHKDYKKVRWIPENIFVQFAKGELTESEFFEKGIWEEIRDPWGNTEQVMHNSIDRLSNTSIGLFYTLEHFIQDGGLFFLVDIKKTGLEDMFAGVFQFFEHTGLGGDSSIGKGSFHFEMENYLGLPVNENFECKLNLSIYFPKKEEVNYYANHGESVWYRMELRKGKVGGRLHVQPDVWKKGINVFSEGSVFPTIPGKEIYGAFPLVKEQKKGQLFDVFYNGFALMVDYNMKG